MDKAIIHPPDLGNLCNALAPESYHSIADIRFEKLGKEHLDLVGCYGNRELILKLLLQSNCINQDRLVTYIDKYQYVSICSGTFTLISIHNVAMINLSSLSEISIRFLPVLH